VWCVVLTVAEALAWYLIRLYDEQNLFSSWKLKALFEPTGRRCAAHWLPTR
jgi:hypothetical protein